MSGQRKPFHWSTKMKSATVASAGRASGRAMRVNTRHSLAPLIRAASSRSRGTERKYCRRRKIPQTCTSSVTISPRKVSTHPSALTSRKRGMSSTIPGTMSVER